MIISRIRRLTETGMVDVPPNTPSVSPPLSANFFVMTPSQPKSYNGADYDMSTEGLYVVMAIATDGTYADGGWFVSYSASALELMRAIMFQTQYGRRDESLTAATAFNQIRLRKLGMRCGPTDSIVTAPILAMKAIPHRTVHLITAAEPTNYDDGHVACEIQINGQWCFFDVPGKVRFENCGVIQNAHQVISAGVANVETVQMCPGSSYPETWSGTLLQTDALYDQEFLFPADANAWRARIYQIVGIDDSDGLTYFYMPAGTESRQAWLLSLSTTYRVLSEADWIARFYP